MERKTYDQFAIVELTATAEGRNELHAAGLQPRLTTKRAIVANKGREAFVKALKAGEPAVPASNMETLAREYGLYAAENTKPTGLVAKTTKKVVPTAETATTRRHDATKRAARLVRNIKTMYRSTPKAMFAEGMVSMLESKTHGRNMAAIYDQKNDSYQVIGNDITKFDGMDGFVKEVCKAFNIKADRITSVKPVKAIVNTMYPYYGEDTYYLCKFAAVHGPEYTAVRSLKV